MLNLGTILQILAAGLGTGAFVLAWFFKSSRLEAFRSELLLAWFVNSPYCEKARLFLLNGARESAGKLGRHDVEERRRDDSDLACAIFKLCESHSDVETERTTRENGLIIYDVIVDYGRSLWWPFDNREKGKTGIRPYYRAARAWDLLGYLLSKKTRRECYEPAVEDLKADFLKARVRYTGRWERQWIWFCMVARTLGILFVCLRIRFAGFLLMFVPHSLRAVWKAISSR